MALPYKFQVEEIIKEKRIIKNDLEEIKKWIQITNIPNLQDEMIALFLLSCCNDLKATKNTILEYFRIKYEGPELFFNRDIDNVELQKAINVTIYSSLPRRMPNNTVIHFFKLQDTNWKNFDLVNSMKVAFMLLDISQWYNPPNELIVLLDLEGANFMHLTCLKISAVKKFIEFLQEAMPLKIQVIHILNANYMFDKCLAIGKIFMKSELLTKIIPHPTKMNMQEFYKNHIPQACLPKDYGGDLPSCDELNQTTIQQFRELKHFYHWEEELVKNYRK